MRGFILLLVIIFLGCISAGAPSIQMAEDLPKPITHDIVWNATHPTLIAKDPNPVRKYQCLLCHEPQASCDSCHKYVGVKSVYEEVAK